MFITFSCYLHLLLELTGWALESGQELAKQDVSTACFWLGPFPIVYVFGVEDLQVRNFPNLLIKGHICFLNIFLVISL